MGGGAEGKTSVHPRGSFCCSSPCFGGGGRFLHGLFEELRWGKYAVALYWCMKVFYRCSPPKKLSSVPFSFGSDMGDHFITPCGACRQVMREVMVRAGAPCLLTPGIVPNPRHHPLTPGIVPDPRNHPLIPGISLKSPGGAKGGVAAPIPSPRAGSGLLKSDYPCWERSIPPCPTGAGAPW